MFKRLTTIFLLTITLFVITQHATRNTFAASASNELKIVFIAYENPDQLVEDVKPVVQYLEKTLNMKVKHFVATDYAGVVEALRGKRADMGFMGPLQYVLAHEQAGAMPILGELYNGKPYYVSRIFVRKDKGIKKLSDLRGKSIAFVDPISSSGYLYPLETFREAGLIKSKDDAEKFFKKIYFAGGDEQAIRAVLNGFADACGVGQYAYNLLSLNERDDIISIADSEKIPSHCVVVRKDLPPAIVTKLQSVLLALNDKKNPNHKLLKNLYNVDGYQKVTHKDYEGCAKLAREYGFVK